MRKLALVVATLTIVPVLAFAADTFTQYGLERAQAEDAFVQFVEYGEAPMIWLPESVKGLSPQKRAALVKEVGEFARNFFRSEAFARRWAEVRSNAAPTRPEPPKSGAEILAEQKAEMAKGIKELEESIQHMPPDQRAAMREAVAQMKQLQASQALQPEMLDESERMRYEDELRRYREDLARMPPSDPTAALEQALRAFLDFTKDIDFKAKLVQDGGRKRFADPRLEAKPSAWKACFRAGREPVEAARTVAQAWLADLAKNRAPGAERK